MTGIYTFARGTLPLLISIPHDGRVLMPEQSLETTMPGIVPIDAMGEQINIDIAYGGSCTGGKITAPISRPSHTRSPASATRRCTASRLYQRTVSRELGGGGHPLLQDRPRRGAHGRRQTLCNGS